MNVRERAPSLALLGSEILSAFADGDPLAPELSGAFGTIQFDGVDPGKMASVLLEKFNIVVVPISGPMVNGKAQFAGLRISPNVYTSMEEMDIFCDAVEKTVPTLRS